MKIGIDIRPLMDKEYSGVSWHTLDLLSEILAQDRQNKYILYYNSGRDISVSLPKFDQPNVKVVSTRYPNKVFNLLEKFAGWPKIDRISGGVDFFWSPHINFISLTKHPRYILTVYDLSFRTYPEFFSVRMIFWHKFLGVKRLIDRAEVVVAISENTKRDLIRLFGIPTEKIKVIYPGIKPDFRQLTPVDPRLTDVKDKYGLPDDFILNVGAFEPRKNIIGLIKAFDLAAGKIGMEKWHLVLAGSRGWKNSLIYQTIKQAKNKERIKIIGYVDKDERVALYNLAKIFAYPSFYEGFGLPVLEAMASGTPAVVSAVSSLPEVTDDAALLVDPHDEQAIASALTALMSDDKLRQFYSFRGLERAKSFTWQKAAEHYLKLFNQ